VFSFLRQLTKWHCSHLLLKAVLLCAVLLRPLAADAVDRYGLLAGPTAATRRTGLWDRHADGHTDGYRTVT